MRNVGKMICFGLELREIKIFWWYEVIHRQTACIYWVSDCSGTEKYRILRVESEAQVTTADTRG